MELYDDSFALLIGVSDYKAGWQDLPQVKCELDTVEEVLLAQGFQVIRIQDPDHQQLTDAFEDFIRQYGFHSDKG